MASVREPVLHPVAIETLRPTQITVGMREVEAKRQAWPAKSDDKGAEFLGEHMVPVIADLTRLEPDAFWFVLDNRTWMDPFDDQGCRRGYDEIPKSVSDLIDDPFRSLAGELRFAGGYAKDTTPFSEFLWADFVRRRIKRKQVEAAFDQALQLAKSVDADYLPGRCGPVAR